MNIREENELKKWKAEKLTLCKNKKSFTCVDTKGDDKELTLKLSDIVGKLKLNSCEETTVMIAHPDMKMFPFSSNLRFSTVTPQVHAQWEQMIVDPTYYAERNLNVTVYCEKANYYEENGEQYVHIVFGEFGGAVNGSHSTASIVEAQLMGIASPEAKVRVFIREYTREVTPEEVAATCTALNSMKKQDDYGNGEVSGYHDSIKEVLADLVNCVEFKPNEKQYDEDECLYWDAVDTVGIMTVMAPNKDGTHTNKFITGSNKGMPYKQYMKAKKNGVMHHCEKILPVLPDCMHLADYVLSTFKTVSKKNTSNFVFKNSDKLSPITKEPVEYELSRLIFYPIMGAMSENIYFNKKTGEVGTYVDFITLYDSVREKFWEHLNNFQKRHGDGGKYLFCNKKVASDLWNLMRSEVKMAIRKG